MHSMVMHTPTLMATLISDPTTPRRGGGAQKRGRCPLLGQSVCLSVIARPHRTSFLCIYYQFCYVGDLQIYFRTQGGH